MVEQQAENLKVVGSTPTLGMCGAFYLGLFSAVYLPQRVAFGCPNAVVCLKNRGVGLARFYVVGDQGSAILRPTRRGVVRSLGK